jgi:hypothetical protein
LSEEDYLRESTPLPTHNPFSHTFKILDLPLSPTTPLDDLDYKNRPCISVDTSYYPGSFDGQVSYTARTGNKSYFSFITTPDAPGVYPSFAHDGRPEAIYTLRPDLSVSMYAVGNTFAYQH